MSSERPIEELGPEVEEKLRAFKANQERIQKERARNLKDSYIGLVRAWAIIGAITGGLLASEKADIGPSDIVNRGIDIVEGLNGQTSEQEKVQYLFKVAPETAFVHDLTAVGEVDEKTGERIPVTLRDRPATEWSFPAEDFNIKDGKDKGKLGLDQPISKALLVWGENPKLDGHYKSVWIAILDDKGDVYFAFSKAGINGLADEVDAPIYNLREVELP